MVVYVPFSFQSLTNKWSSDESRVSSGAKAHFLVHLKSELKLRPPETFLRSPLVANARFLGKLGCAPAAAEGFDEENAGVHAAALDVYVVALVLESNGLCVDELEVGAAAASVAIREELKRIFGRGGGFGLLLIFVVEDAQGGEIVLHFLECGERGLPI